MKDFLAGGRRLPAERRRLRRHRLGQDDAAQHPVRLHRRARARGHDRRRRRAQAAAAPRGAPRNAAGQHRRQGRRTPARSGGQRPAYASGPHRRRRSPRRRGPGHAPGDEHRPRRQLDDDPRQLAARRAVSPGHHGRDGQPQYSGEGDPAADRVGGEPDRAGVAHVGRHEEGHGHLRAHRHGGRGHHHAGHLRVRTHGYHPGRPGARAVPGDRDQAEVRGAACRIRAFTCRWTCSSTSRSWDKRGHMADRCF